VNVIVFSNVFHGLLLPFFGKKVEPTVAHRRGEKERKEGGKRRIDRCWATNTVVYYLGHRGADNNGKPPREKKKKKEKEGIT